MNGKFSPLLFFKTWNSIKENMVITGFQPNIKSSENTMRLIRLRNFENIKYGIAISIIYSGRIKPSKIYVLNVWQEVSLFLIQLLRAFC